jgi:two-component system CheB/CheR fusion protein
VAQRSPSGASPSSSQASRATGPLRVIVVDDHPDTVMTLLAILRGEGFDAKGFGSGREALKNLGDFNPDVVISDIGMPSVNGWELARQVRQAMGRTRPMLIAISGQYTKSADKSHAEAAGFNHFLMKPCDPKALLALISPLQSSN